MNSHFSIKTNFVHLWRVFLPDFIREIDFFYSILSTEEQARASCFKFELHKHRFIITRAILRTLLSLYTGASPNDIIFCYTSKGKPYLPSPYQAIQFNVSHSKERAVYGFRMEEAIGVDIEKIEFILKEAVAKRFFSPKEYAVLKSLPFEKQIPAFYHMWSCKEAVVKASGQGLSMLFSQFTISLNESNIVPVLFNNESHEYYVQAFKVGDDYSGAVATTKGFCPIEWWEWSKKGPIPLV